MKQSEYATLVVSIKGLQDGKYPVELSAEAEKIEYIFPEFTGTLTVEGILRKHGKRFLFDLTAVVPARLLCDVSGEEYQEIVTATLSLEYVADTHLALLKADDNDGEPPFYIRDDATSINITDEIRQELVVMLPLKRISPKYRDKEFIDVFPDFAEQAEKEAAHEANVDPRWAALQSIKFDT